MTGRRWISEHHTLKVLIEPRGCVLGLTMTTYSFLFFVTRRFVGVKKIRTQDRIVAKAGYSAPKALDLVAEYYPDGP